MSGTINDVLSVLVELQLKDAELKRLLDGRQLLPASMKAKDDELESEGTVVREKEEELKALSKRRKAQEADLEDIAAKIMKLETRLSKVATNKEYEATLAEINNTKELQSNAEGELLKLMEREEELAGEVSRYREEFEPRAREIEDSKKRMQMELDHNEQLIPAVQKNREEIAARLSSSMRSTYERIAKGKNGVAVVPVKKGACGGCFTALPAQRINEIKIADRLVVCEYCGRILVWNDLPVDEGGQV